MSKKLFDCVKHLDGAFRCSLGHQLAGTRNPLAPTHLGIPPQEEESLV